MTGVTVRVVGSEQNLSGDFDTTVDLVDGRRLTCRYPLAFRHPLREVVEYPDGQIALVNPDTGELVHPFTVSPIK